MATISGRTWNGCGRSLSGADAFASSIGRSFRVLSEGLLCISGSRILCVLHDPHLRGFRHRADADSSAIRGHRGHGRQLPSMQTTGTTMSVRLSLARQTDVAVQCHPLGSVRSERWAVITIRHRSDVGPQGCRCWVTNRANCVRIAVWLVSTNVWPRPGRTSSRRPITARLPRGSDVNPGSGPGPIPDSRTSG